MNNIVLILAAYLLGSIPFGVIIARAHGVNLRTVGSGNTGATNVFRTVGKKWGVLCFVLDFLKGFVAAGLLPFLLRGMEISEVGLICGAAAIVGHNWPVWLRFRGGKGIATSAGVLAAVAPLALLLGLGVWGVTMKVSRMVSLASIFAAVAVSAGGWLFYRESMWTAWVLTGLGVVAVVRHRSNVARILKGEEHKFGKPRA